ncbi:MAG TPA: hypothetical protein VF525_02355 [Pyrinomonadaceae bacterium]|jgi:amino acid transporter
MHSEQRELLVIVAAMLVFLVICIAAMVLFFRQLRRERGPRRKPKDQARRF